MYHCSTNRKGEVSLVITPGKQIIAGHICRPIPGEEEGLELLAEEVSVSIWLSEVKQD